MSSSSVNASSPCSIRYFNTTCGCGRRAAIRISEKERSKGLLYSCCEKPKETSCGYFAWCVPIDWPTGSRPEAKFGPTTDVVDTTLESGLVSKEEMNKVKSRLKKLEKFNESLMTVVKTVVVLFAVVVFVSIIKNN